MREDLLEVRVGNNEKFHVVGPGLELAQMPTRSAAIQRLGILQARFTVTWIGRAVEVKAPHRVLEIAQMCKSRKLDIRFLFVGNGPLEDQLKKSALSKDLNVNFLGWQSEIEEILSVSDLVILTSLNEGTPVALIQAQMAGIPVLATSVGSAPEVMIHGNSGYALPYSRETFANVIMDFAENPRKCQEFGKNGRNYSRSKFSLENLVEAHEELYRLILSQIGRASCRERVFGYV